MKDVRIDFIAMVISLKSKGRSTKGFLSRCIGILFLHVRLETGIT